MSYLQLVALQLSKLFLHSICKQWIHICSSLTLDEQLLLQSALEPESICQCNFYFYFHFRLLIGCKNISNTNLNKLLNSCFKISNSKSLSISASNVRIFHLKI